MTFFKPIHPHSSSIISRGRPDNSNSPHTPALHIIYKWLNPLLCTKNAPVFPGAPCSLLNTFSCNNLHSAGVNSDEQITQCQTLHPMIVATLLMMRMVFTAGMHLFDQDLHVPLTDLGRSPPLSPTVKLFLHVSPEGIRHLRTDAIPWLPCGKMPGKICFVRNVKA